MPSTVSFTVEHLADWGMCRSLSCHGCLCQVPGGDSHVGAWVLLYLSVADLRHAAGGAMQMLSKGPTIWMLGWAKVCCGTMVCLHFVWGKKWPPRCFFFSPSFWLSAFLDCSVLREAKRWTNHRDCSSLSNTEVVQMQDSKCQACCFTIIQLHEQQTKKQQLYL